MMMPPPPSEEKPPVPPGYTVVMQGRSVVRGGQQSQGAPRVTALGRPSAIERGGQFIPSGYHVQPFGAAQGMRLGEIPIANVQAVRQPTLSPVMAQATTTPVGTEPAPETLPVTPNGNGNGNGGPPPHAKAWGKLKKKDAAELAEYLAEIEQRMDAVNIPPGIVKQIREKLETFATSPAPEEAEIELSDTEAAALNVAIMNLETVEGQTTTPSFGTAAAVVAGLGILTVLVVG